jgi:hypothetical protein
MHIDRYCGRVCCFPGADCAICHFYLFRVAPVFWAQRKDKLFVKIGMCRYLSRILAARGGVSLFVNPLRTQFSFNSVCPSRRPNHFREKILCSCDISSCLSWVTESENTLPTATFHFFFFFKLQTDSNPALHLCRSSRSKE